MKLIVGIVVGVALGAGSLAFASPSSTPSQQQQHAKISHQITALRSDVRDISERLVQTQTEHDAQEMNYLLAINRKVDSLCAAHHVPNC